MEEKVTQINDVVQRLENKNFGFYFFTLDTKGNPAAGIANIYEHVKTLNELGYKAYIMHEKNDYKIKGDENSSGVADWLGEEYSNLPHISIEGQQLNIGPSDFIIIPEIFANVMEQVKHFPCKKIVLSQSPEFLLELLPIGRRWTDYGFNEVITTSQKQANYIKSLFPSVNTNIIPVSIPSYFKPSSKPKIPIVTILTRNQGDAAKIAKTFYLQNPIYKWVTFKELRGMSRKDFANALGESCLAIWTDQVSGFGTFPLECFESNTPLIGLIPNMVPEYMETKDEAGNLIIKNNAIWTNTTQNISELIATFMKLYLEDSIPQELLNSMNESKGQYTPEKQKSEIERIYGTLVENRKQEFLKLLTQPEPQTNNA